VASSSSSSSSASSSLGATTLARDGDDGGASPPSTHHPSPYARGGGGRDHGGRLDVDAEDEATSHWVGTADAAAEKSRGGFANGMLDKFDGGGRGGGEAAAADPTSGGSALYNSFVRAGGTRGPAPARAADVDRSDDGSPRPDPHREVDPLERVDHRGVPYAPFRRTFHVPSDTIGGRSWRDEHDVACTPPIYDPMLGFGDLVSPPPRCDDDDDDDGDGTAAGGSSDVPVFPEELTRAIIKCGYDSPTIVQSQTLAVALSGCDALITASTGSGKTLAYIWPMIVHINDQAHIEPGIDGPIGIVLTPTRELARQVYRYAKIFVECIGGRAVEVSGGNRGTWELTKELRLGCEIVVGSPGRLIDVVRKKGTNLRRVTFLVLDEADRMLDMGFEKQVNSIMENVRPDRQTLLLSATFGKRVEKVARSWLRNPVR
jgi:ATP-dependent RNA helicase DDX42